MSVSTNARNKKKYSVGGYGGSRFAYADTLAEAKRAGAAIAKKESYRGKWNVSYIPVSIRQADTKPPYFSYGKPLMTMFVPVRGTGAKAERIEETIRRREGVKPFVWKKGG